MKSNLSETDEIILQRIAELDQKALALCDSKDYEGALRLFDEIVVLRPTHASVYNNRALVHQLQGNNDAALMDLELAIQYGKDHTVRQRSFTQKGFILLHRDAESKEARDSFAMAAKYGSTLAKQTLVSLNPYSKLCGAMVCEMMRQYR